MPHVRTGRYSLKTKHFSCQVSSIEAKQKQQTNKDNPANCPFTKRIKYPTMNNGEERVKTHKFHAQIIGKFWREGAKLRTEWCIAPGLFPYKFSLNER